MVFPRLLLFKIRGLDSIITAAIAAIRTERIRYCLFTFVPFCRLYLQAFALFQPYKFIAEGVKKNVFPRNHRDAHLQISRSQPVEPSAMSFIFI